MILDFKPRLGNRCKVVPVYARLRASILDFRARLRNRCRVLPVYALLRAVILDFRARLGNQCKVFPVYTIFRALILDFRPRLGNRCKGEWFRLLQPSLPPQRSASDSNLRSGKEEWFRLQRAWRTQAGTGCHEGGIILSTKPPERHLSLPPQRSASDSNLRSGKEERFRLQRAWRTQAGTGCHEGGIILSKKPPEWRMSPPQQRSASESNFVAAEKNGFACSGCCGNREWFLRLQV